MIEKYFTWLFYADFIIPLVIIGAVFLFWAVYLLAVLIARGWDKRQKRLADRHSKKPSKHGTGEQNYERID